MNKNAKIVVAVVCFLIAGAVIAWQSGLFGSSAPEGAESNIDYDALDAQNEVDDTGPIEVITTPEGRAMRRVGGGN
ncbi:MAG: hypothetical protein Tsb0013_14470 [Phycisphaerales bacterium]